MNQKLTKGMGLSIALLLGAQAGFAQLSGVKTIPGNYASISAAVAALNSQGVGAGGVTFNIAAGYTETLAAPLSLTATGTAAAPIVFQKSGSGLNPSITTYTGGIGSNTSAAPDGIWTLNGSDYVTIDGINISENGANSGNALMEYGFGLFKADAANGCQNVTIKNSTITLNRANITNGTAPMLDGSIGILAINSTAAAANVPLTVTSAAGANSNNKFYANIIQNTNIGIGLSGFADAPPFAFADGFNDVGGTSLATGNTILNFGGGTTGSIATDTLASGILAMYQYDLNASRNIINSNNGNGVAHNSTIHGIYTKGGDNANATISNNTITLNRKLGVTVTAASVFRMAGIETAAGSNGTSNTVLINGNTITNCKDSSAVTVLAHTSTLTSDFYGIWNTATAYNLSVTQNTISNDTTYLNAGTFMAITNSGAVANNILVDANDISNLYFKSVTSPNASNVRLMINSSSSAGLGCTTAYTNNNFHDITSTTPFSGTYFECMDLNAVGATTVASMSGNHISNISISRSGTGAVNGLLHGNQNGISNIVNIQNNTINGFTITGTSAFPVMGISGMNRTAATDASTVNMSSNSVYNLNVIGGTGTLNPISYVGASSGSLQTLNINNNIVDSVNSSATAISSAIAGLAVTGGVTGSTISGNVVEKMYSAGGSTGHNVYGIQLLGAATGFNVSGNQIDSLVCASQAVTGISQSSNASQINYYSNKINNLSGNGSASTVYGLNVAATSGTALLPDNINIYNNLIGNLNAPAANSSSDLIKGIYLSSTAAFTNFDVFFNTIYLNASSTGAALNSSGIYQVSSGTLTTSNLSLKNNVIVNNSTTGTGSTGIAAAIKRSTTTSANFDVSSDNNLLKASSVYYDGTSNYTTLLAYATAFPSQGLHSVSENVTFQSTNGNTVGYLKPSLSVATAIESGGVAIPGITTDYAGTTRNVLTPDLGAYEANYIVNDMVAPVIAFTPVTDTTSILNRTLNGFATITDAGTVNATAGNAPRLYFKRATDANVMGANNASFSGWKYVEATTPATSPFSFTINYNLLTSPAVGGDVIQYFLVAQDMATPSNAGGNGGVVFPNTFTSVANTPAPTSGWNSYKILAMLSGTINVGATEQITSLTNSGGLFDIINNGIVTGNINAVITSDLSAETGAVTLNKWNESGTGNYKLNIAPDGITTRTVSGTPASAASMIVVSGARNVTFNGNYAGNGQYLRLRNLQGSSTSSLITFQNDAKADTLINCILEGTGISTTTGATVVSLSTTVAGGTGNDSIVIMNNTIRDLSNSVTYVPGYLIKSNGFSSSITNDNIIISGNQFINWSTDAIGIGTSTGGGNNWIIRNNSLYQTANRASGIYGIHVYANGGNGHLIDNNDIGGSASDRSGAPITTSSATLYGIYTQSTSTSSAPITVSNNRISNLYSSSTTAIVYPINTSSYTNIVNNVIGGGLQSYDTIGTAGTGNIGIYVSGGNNTIKGNLIKNMRSAATTNIMSAGVSIMGGTCVVDSNTIDSITSFTGATQFGSNTLCGINVGILASSSNIVISNNSVSNLINANTSAASTAVGIQTGSANQGFTKIFNNKINNIVGSSSGVNLMAGIGDNSNSADSIYNNTINIGSNIPGQAVLRALFDLSGGTTNGASTHTYVNNTVIVRGNTTTGTTTAFFRTNSNNTVVLKNNIFLNQRSLSGVGNNYAIYNNATTTTSTWKSDYNLVNNADTTKIANWVGSLYSFSGFKTIAASDTNSMMGNVPFVNLANNDLHIDGTNADAWNVFGRGMAMQKIPSDISGNVRSTVIGTPTTIGAYETATPTAAPANMVMIPATPTLGTPTVFYSAGRKIAQIIWTGTAPASLTGVYHPGVQAPNPTTTGPNLNSYLELTASPDVSTYNYVITTYYTTAEANGIPDISLTGIKKHTGSNTYVATDNGGTFAADASGKFLTSNPLTDFSIFTMTGDITPLLIDLKDISAKNVATQNRIDWSTASEDKADKFELERSLDGKNFSALASINAKGQPSAYTYWDTKAALGTNYYRIKLNNAAGAVVYSKIVSAEVASLQKFAVNAYPNPVQNKVSLQINGTIQTNASVEVSDVTGKLLQHLKVTGNEMDIEMSNLAQGIYFIKYSDDQQSRIVKISKQ